MAEAWQEYRDLRAAVREEMVTLGELRKRAAFYGREVPYLSLRDHVLIDGYESLLEAMDEQRENLSRARAAVSDAEAMIPGGRGSSGGGFAFS